MPGLCPLYVPQWAVDVGGELFAELVAAGYLRVYGSPGRDDTHNEAASSPQGDRGRGLSSGCVAARPGGTPNTGAFAVTVDELRDLLSRYDGDRVVFIGSLTFYDCVAVRSVEPGGPVLLVTGSGRSTGEIYNAERETT